MGEYCEPTWACLRGSKKGEILPSRVQDFETDVSVYGVRGLAGNVQIIVHLLNLMITLS